MVCATLMIDIVNQVRTVLMTSTVRITDEGGFNSFLEFLCSGLYAK